MDTYARQTPFVAGIRTSSRNPLLSPASKYTEKYSELETCPGFFSHSRHESLCGDFPPERTRLIYFGSFVVRHQPAIERCQGLRATEGSRFAWGKEGEREREKEEAKFH